LLRGGVIAGQVAASQLWKSLPMTKNEAIQSLRTLLVTLDPRAQDAARLAEDAGLNLAYIDLGGSPINQWHAILNEASRRDKVDALILAALRDYGDLEPLRQARLDYQAATGGPASPLRLPPTEPQMPESSAELSRISNQELLSELRIVLTINPADPQQSEYLVQLWHDGQPLAEERTQIDRTALLEVEHTYDAAAYGLLLYRALFSGQVERTYQQLIGQLDANATLRIQLVISEQAGELHALPWERLFQPVGNQTKPLAAGAATPFSRCLISGAGDQPAITTRPLRLLLALANPSHLPVGLSPIDVASEVGALADLLAASQGQVTGELLPGHGGLPVGLRQRLVGEGWRIHNGPTTWANIQRHLHGQPIFHLLAHGQLVADRQAPARSTAYLLLEDETGALSRVADQTIVDGLNGVHPLPPLIFLAACESAKRPATAQLGQPNPFVGLAPKLVQAGVPAVVAMQDRIPVDLARTLTLDFYRRLWVHGQVDRALNEGRALLLQRDAFAWAIPVLFLRLAGGQLFVAQPTAPPPVASPSAAHLSDSPPPAPIPLPTLTRLNGAQFGQLQQALLEAFTGATLRQMVRVELDQNLEAIAGGENLGVVVFNLIEWAQRTGNLTRLFQGALNAAPGNAVLQTFVRTLGGTQPAEPTRSHLAQLKRQTLEERLAVLSKQYTAVSNQRNTTLNAADEVKLQGQLAQLAEEIRAVEAELQAL
jgi:hypothetical protein